MGGRSGKSCFCVSAGNYGCYVEMPLLIRFCNFGIAKDMRSNFIQLNFLSHTALCEINQHYTKTTPTIHQQYTETTTRLPQDCTNNTPTIHQHYTKTTPTIHYHYTRIKQMYTKSTQELHKDYTKGTPRLSVVGTNET